MKKITVSFAIKMKEIYKLIHKRMKETGTVLETDILFIQLYNSYFYGVDFKEGEEQ